MTKPLTFRHITSKALERAKRTTSYALLECDLFRAHGPTAVRYLTDDERRQLARLGHDIGWRRLNRVAVIATIRTIRRWFRELIGQTEKRRNLAENIAPVRKMKTRSCGQLAGKHLRLTITERLTAAKHAKLIPLAMRTLVQWIVSPESLIRWLKRYQQRRANSCDTEKDASKEKRPWIGAEKVAAILRIYDSGLEGLSRIVGEMDKCGHKVVESTVRRVLTANGRPPVDGNHRRGSTWAQFWNRHAPFLVGVDFMQIPVGIMGKIVNAFVFCAIEHDTRRVHLLGITLHPTDEWIANVLRTATAEGAPLAGRKFWLLDNDRKYGQRTTATLGKRALWTSVRAPDMNSVIERWNKSAKEECLNHVVFVSEEHLRQYVTSYILHYNTERPHQGINNVPIGPWTVGTGEIVCDESLHGLLKSFRRAA